MAPKTLSEPLLVRPGVRFHCVGDGLCCTDIHVLGPITKKEAKKVRALDERGVLFDDDLDKFVLRPSSDGGCHFLLSDQRCAIHAEQGMEAKPSGCRRFPLGLTETPEGGRVTTFHRCPCRSLGARPLLDAEAARPSIVDRKGHLESEREVKKVRLAAGEKKVAWAQWRALEEPLIAALLGGGDPMALLAAEPFPPLKKTTWPEALEELEEGRDGSAFGTACLHFLEGARLCLDPGARLRLPMRPWSPAFDRAEARKGEGAPGGAEAVFGDWVADEIWSLSFTDRFDFATKRHELASRLAIAKVLAGAYAEGEELSARHAAEALMVVEIVGESEHWTDLLAEVDRKALLPNATEWRSNAASPLDPAPAQADARSGAAAGDSAATAAADSAVGQPKKNAGGGRQRGGRQRGGSKRGGSKRGGAKGRALPDVADAFSRR